MNIDIEAIKKCNRWNSDFGEILLAIDSAIVSMGSFQNPLEKELQGLTLGQWQFERAKRVAIAVANALTDDDS